MLEKWEIKFKAQSLANLLVALRSTAFFYPTREGRRAWLEQLLFDVRFDETARDYALKMVLPPPARVALVDFCSGHIGAHRFGKRINKAFRSLEKVDLFWLTLYDQFRSLTSHPRRNEDCYDARIEFARRITLDLHNVAPTLTAQSSDENDAFVTYDECVCTLMSIGHLNKSVVRTTIADQPTDDLPIDTTYTVCLFGSNCIWIVSDAMYTLKPTNKRPHAFENVSETTGFINILMALARTEFIPDAAECCRASVRKMRPVITSVSRNDVSVQLSFAMPDSRFYTADIFYLSGSNKCCTDFRYKRERMSNACRCENRLTSWRMFVAVAALDDADLETPVNNLLTRFVTDVMRAFYRSKYDQGAHFYINQYTGTTLVNYMNDSVAIGGMIADANIADDSSAAASCDIHLWLRAHTNKRHWHPIATWHIARILAKHHQTLVVYRPLISDTVMIADGPNVFLNYKSFDDVLTKYVLVTSNTLERGYEGTSRAIAYKCSDGFWLYSEHEQSADGERSSKGSPSDTRHTVEPPWKRMADKFGDSIIGTYDRSSGSSKTKRLKLDGSFRPPFFGMHRDTDDMFHKIFSAPSRLHVHANVLTKLGLNVTAVSAGVPARTFMHTDPTTGNSCTVISSCPLVITDEESGLPIKSTSGVEALKVLQLEFDTEHGVLEQNRSPPEAGTARNFNESVVSINEFWPGVNAVRIEFEDPVLDGVQFVFFAAHDGDEAIGRLTNDGLTRLGHYNTKHSFHLLSPPVLFAVQRIFIAL